MRHDLKLWPQFYEPARQGLKTFEVRHNDRGFQAGDYVTLREWDPDLGDVTNLPVGIPPTPKGYTSSPPLEFKIGYVLPIDENRVVFSLVKVPLLKEVME